MLGLHKLVISFPFQSITYGVAAAYLDHAQIWLETDFRGMHIRRKGKPFQFKSLWVGQEECLKIIESVWTNKPFCARPQQIPEMLKLCGGGKLDHWNKSSFGN